MKGRADQIAKDLFEFGGATYSITKLCKFLGASRYAAEAIVQGLLPCCGKNTGRRYYYRDIAEKLAQGVFPIRYK